MKTILGCFAVCLALAAARIQAAESPAQSANASDKVVAKLAGIVVDDQGAPIAGADVAYSWWVRGKNQSVAGKSDDQGRFVLAPPEMVGGAAGTSAEIWAGIAGRRVAHEVLFADGKPPAEELRLTLRPAAKVAVKVVGPDGKPVRKARLALPMVTREGGRSTIVPEALLPCTDATTDDEGTATITAFDRGGLSELRVTTAEYGSQSKHLAPSGQATGEPLVVTLRSAGRVRGRLISSEPDLIDGVAISLISISRDPARAAEATIGSAVATSDKSGRFEVPAIAEGTIGYISVESKPGRPFLPDPPAETSLAAGQTANIEIPFRRAVQVRGVIRQETTGKPLADVSVSLSREGAGSSSSAITDSNGRFDFVLVSGPYNLFVISLPTHDVPGWFKQRHFQVPGGVNDLELPPVDLVVARGRVVDGAGNGVAGAKIEKAETKMESHGQLFESQAFWYSEPRELSTDAHGEYRAWVEAGAAYRALVHVDGHTPQWTAWTEFGGDKPAVFPDVVIDSLKSIGGRVVDRQGRPVAGVTVIQSGDGPQRTETTTDGEGRFELTGYQHESGYVFAEKPEFRFHGQAVKAGDNQVRIVLSRASEPPGRRRATLPEADPKGDEALALRVLAPALDRLPKSDDRERQTVLRDLALIDPAFALDRLETLGIKGDTADMLRLEVAKGWSADHPDDAMAIIEALDDAYGRAAGYVLAAEAMPASLRDRKVEWLAKARVHLRGAGDPTMRTALTAMIARMLFENGEKDEASKLVAQIKPAVEQMPLDEVSAYVRGVTAEALALSDLPAALALIKDVQHDGEYNRHHGNIARILAASQPADALRVLKLVRDAFQRDQYAVHVARLVAPDDRKRAAETVELIANPQLKALAEALMAEALGKSDAKRAAAQLERAYDALAKLAASDAAPTYGYHAAPLLAAWFLLIVETLEPDRVEEYVWRSLSLRLPLAKQADRAHVALTSRAYLAMLLSRYDHDLARELFGDLPAETGLAPGEFSVVARNVYAAAAVIDSSRALAAYEKLPDDLPYDTKGQVRHALVDILSKHGEARWQAAANHLNMPMPWNPIQ
ncbi:MAG TPA: carboxypeptidase-like regulatory domain-containing protein [Pirellulales bacterium]|nr:carboxypeptidase-like regulatory domain-containing protein [Pirellulales bacterium]